MIIGISGKKGSGKDTVGNMIQWLTSDSYKNNLSFINENGYESSSFQIKKFADSLKDMVCILLGCTREQLEDRDFKEKELSSEWTKYRIITKDLPNYYVSSEEEAKTQIRHSNQRYVKVPMTPRLLLQLLGTECGRDIIHPNIWVNSLMSKYKTDEYPTPTSLMKVPNWIITDMRFPNELKAVESKGGITIRINRDAKCKECGVVGGHKMIPHKNQGHPSETALDNAEFDYVIYNNGTIEDLVEKVKQILIEINIL